MVVELHDAVVADVAVGAARRSENVTRLTELEFEHERRVNQVHLHVVYSGFASHIVVLIRHIAFHTTPTARWHDAWLSGRRVEHEKVCGR